MHLLKWLYPGLKFKRWLALFGVGVLSASLGLVFMFSYRYIGRLEELIFKMVYSWTGTYHYAVTSVVGVLALVAGVVLMMVATRYIIRSVISVLIPDSSEKLVDMIYEKRRLDRGPAIAVIGGGTGLSVLLRGLKKMTKNITAIVTVADDGGSSGRLREELGIIPPGDLRNCLVALADTEPLMEKLFQHRFGGASDLAGHSFGNLFIAAMTEVVGDVEQALLESSKVLAVKGRVLPSSTERVRLVATMDDGSIVEGESQIPLVNKRIKRLHLYPPDVKPVASAVAALENAEVIILGPGSLYTSILPNLLVDGMTEALRRSKAVKVYLCNVMTQPGETDGYTASMHVKTLIDHVGTDIIDYVLVNSAPIAPNMRGLYALEGAVPVVVDEDELEAMNIKIVKADLINETNVVRHDPVKLSETITKMIYNFTMGNDRIRVLGDFFTRKMHK